MQISNRTRLIPLALTLFAAPGLAQTGTLDQASPATNASFNWSAPSLIWQQQVIGQHGMAYSGWQYAKPKQTSCKPVDPRGGIAGPYRCVVMGAPCRAHP